jgi:hypothetical protein
MREGATGGLTMAMQQWIAAEEYFNGYAKPRMRQWRRFAMLVTVNVDSRLIR